MPDLTQQTVLITGATSGIGEITARELARQGARVVLLARSADKAEATRQAIRAAAGHDRVEVLLADLANLGQVRRAAAEFLARHQQLDGLVNNAGLLFGAQRQVSPDGHEMTLATNHLGHFLLTALLLDALRQSPAARIVNVASTAYKIAHPDFNDLQAMRDYAPMRMYGNTKLYNIMFTQELARRLRAAGIHNVTANSVHPGVVATGFGSKSGGLMSLGLKVMRPFLLTAEQGAATSIFLATDPSVASVSGGHFDKKKAVPVKSPYNTPENARRLWQESERLVEQPFVVQ